MPSLEHLLVSGDIKSPEKVNMEGTLWKWTNYFSGWQPRWFVLQDGILSYYRSEDDVVNGCRGSIKMSVCDVIVHPGDATRIDLTIPTEAHFCVKSATPQERQQWLVALGSSKACLTNIAPAATTQPDIPEEQLKAKKSELRLYCDLLMQQVHSVKTAVKNEDPPSVQQLDDATSLLSATCDTFIQTLDDCMKLSHASTQQPPPSPTRKSMSRQTSRTNNSVNRSISTDSQRSVNSVNVEDEIVTGYIPSTTRSKSPGLVNSSRSRTPSESSLHSTNDFSAEGLTLSIGPETTQQISSTPSPRNSVTGSSTGFNLTGVVEEEEEYQIQTMFTSLPASFMDIKLSEDGGIPTLIFLDSCREILPIFDKLNSTAFAPVKMDMAGNIRKIQQKFHTSPDQFGTLQSLVVYELQHKEHTNYNSATCALLWLKRALEYTREFMSQVLVCDTDLSDAANKAYSSTLKKYHSFVLRGVFSVYGHYKYVDSYSAGIDSSRQNLTYRRQILTTKFYPRTLVVKAVPDKRTFIEQLAMKKCDTEKESFEVTLLRQMEEYATAMNEILKILSDFYIDQGLDGSEQV